jgi:hypothetical protein
VAPGVEAGPSGYAGEQGPIYFATRAQGTGGGVTGERRPVRSPADDLLMEQCQFVCLDPKLPEGAWYTQVFVGNMEDLAWVWWYWAEGAGWQALSQARATREVYIRTRVAGLSEAVHGSLYPPQRGRGPPV